MLKDIVFMSQMDRPCFSHSKTHVGKYNPRSVAKVVVISAKLKFFCTSVSVSVFIICAMETFLFTLI